MKKLFAILVVMVMVLYSVSAFAEIDAAGMSTDELHRVMDAARNELVKRELTAAGDTVLFDQDGASAYLTGQIAVNDIGNLTLETVFINGTDKTLALTVDNASINGWTVFTMGITDTMPGNRTKGYLEFSLSDASITTLDEVKDITITFNVFDTESFETVTILAPVTIHF